MLRIKCLKPNWLIIFTIVFFLSLLSTKGLKSEGKSIVKKKEITITNKLTISYPSMLSVSKKSPVEDYDIYTFESENAAILSLYAGNQPKPDLIDCVNQRGENIDKLKIYCRPLNIPDKKQYAKECLIDLSDVINFPQYLHFWYNLESLKKKNIADEIIKSCNYSG